ncbi:hypothetical protein V5O48_016413 [Marasmius crinis-equi]|uniref:Uncharacterized protein n=1 Tax=Marasmius crinis-equi TaxID=585013 RepID=A0ABR3ERT7_9AGAR
MSPTSSPPVLLPEAPSCVSDTKSVKSLDRAAASVFVKPHPKLSDLPVESVPSTPGPTTSDSKHVYVIMRAKSIETVKSEKSQAVVVLCSSPPTSFSSLESDESDPSAIAAGAHQELESVPQKKKKWSKVFTRSNSAKKPKSYLDDKDSVINATLSAPATPLVPDTPSTSPKLPQHAGSKSVPSSPRISRPSPKVLRKAAPPHLNLNLKPDYLSSKLHLSPADLSKVNAYFAYGSGDTPGPAVTPASGKTPIPMTPRTPGGTVIPPHLFTPGHLVDRESFLEQIHRRQRGTADMVDPLLARVQRRPLSLVPELAEGTEDGCLSGDDDVPRHDEIAGYSVEAALAVIYEAGALEDSHSDNENDIGKLRLPPNLPVDGIMSHSEGSSCVYFTVDPEWKPMDGVDAVCYFVDGPFPENEQEIRRNADVLTRFNDGFERST